MGDDDRRGDGALPEPEALRGFPLSLARRLWAPRGQDLRPTPAQFARFRSFARIGDPLADDLVAAGVGGALVDQAFRHGIDAISTGIGTAVPEELVALCRAVEGTPVWVDQRLVDAGARAVARVGPLGLMPLANLSLMGGYLAARVNKTLLGTGDLHADAARRLAETAGWWTEVTTPGSLAVGGEGYVQALRVRLVHAHVRAAMRQRDDWDYEAWDHPINQAQLVGTLLLFSLVFLLGARALGVRFSRAERRAVMHLWRYIGWLMGIDDELLPADEADGWRLVWLLAATELTPDEDSKHLAAALLAAAPAISPIAADNPLGRLAGIGVSHLNVGMSRTALGRTNAEHLGLPASPAGQAAVVALSTAVWAMETTRRLVPGATALQARIGLMTRRSYVDRMCRRLT